MYTTERTNICMHVYGTCIVAAQERVLRREIIIPFFATLLATSVHAAVKAPGGFGLTDGILFQRSLAPVNVNVLHPRGDINSANINVCTPAARKFLIRSHKDPLESTRVATKLSTELRGGSGGPTFDRQKHTLAMATDQQDRADEIEALEVPIDNDHMHTNTHRHTTHTHAPLARACECSRFLSLSSSSSSPSLAPSLSSVTFRSLSLHSLSLHSLAGQVSVMTPK